MGCETSKEAVAVVNDGIAAVTQNGTANHHQNNSNENGTGASTQEEDLSDLNLQDPELEKAATRIQATFRGHNARKNLQNSSYGNKIEEEVIDIDLNDPEVGIAASKIQASFRGHKANKEKKEAEEKAKAEAELSAKLQKLKTSEQPVTEEDDMPDLNDPEVEKAATKIQAHFKGHLVRKSQNKDSN